MKKKSNSFRFYWEEDRKKENEPEINIEIPGFNKDEIRVSVDNNFLNIWAEKKQKKTEKGKDFFRQEMMQSSFRRSMSLPEGTDPSNFDIKVDDGAVRIRKK